MQERTVPALTEDFSIRPGYRSVAPILIESAHHNTKQNLGST